MIALGAAKGLAFLHNAERPVIYRDFKTSNILLDSVTSLSFHKFLQDIGSTFQCFIANNISFACRTTQPSFQILA